MHLYSTKSCYVETEHRKCYYVSLVKISSSIVQILWPLITVNANIFQAIKCIAETKFTFLFIRLHIHTKNQWRVNNFTKETLQFES